MSDAGLPSTPPLPPALWVSAACVAVAFPTLLAFNLPPSSTFLNQAAAFIGWGLWALLLATSGITPGWPWRGALAGLLAVLAALGGAALAAPLWAGLPWSLALSALGTLAAAALLVVIGAALTRQGLAVAAVHALCVALLVAGTLGAAIGVVQVLAPQWADGTLVAHTGLVGRAAGNLRQPNHLSSLLLWSLVALVWLAERQRVGWGWAAAAVLLIAGLVLSASRTGMLGVALLALWGLLDARLSRRSRWLLLLSPLVFALLWAGVTEWSHHSAQVFGGEGQLARGDISSSRFAIWSDTLGLIARHPWLGVGWGEFNFAWTLTPFPHRPVAFFDHTHNLPLQFAVELGLPLAGLLLALLGWALWRAFVAGRDGADSALASSLRAAFLIVLMMALHSQLEYPLWYAHFLLPTAFAFGLCLGAERPAAPVRRAPPREPAGTRPLWLGAAMLLLGGGAAVYDYLRVVVIFAPSEQAAPLADRIAEGQRSWLFGHHGDYAAVTTPTGGQVPVLSEFERAPHYLLDSRLMMAWARALEAAGDGQRARHLARRLKEFHNDNSAEFFAACAAPAASAAQGLPFQCEDPSTVLDYRDFR